MYEHQKMYPTFAEKAYEEGFNDIGYLFEQHKNFVLDIFVVLNSFKKSLEKTKQ